FEYEKRLRARSPGEPFTADGPKSSSPGCPRCGTVNVATARYCVACEILCRLRRFLVGQPAVYSTGNAHWPTASSLRLLHLSVGLRRLPTCRSGGQYQDGFAYSDNWSGTVVGSFHWCAWRAHSSHWCSVCHSRTGSFRACS